MTLLYSAAVRLQAQSVRQRDLSFRFSAGFAGPGRSITDHLTGARVALPLPTVQDVNGIRNLVLAQFP
jgi:hypothetical protein